MRFQRLAVGIGILAVAVLWQVRAGQGNATTKQGSQDKAELVKHGKYLVSSVTMCGDCHTPRDDRGQPDQSRLLRGATLSIRPKTEIKGWTDESPDITASGLAGEWSEEEMVELLTTGITPHGAKAKPPMPAFRLDAKDARAVYLYLKSLPGQGESAKSEKGKDSE